MMVLVSVAFPDPQGSASFWEAGSRVISRIRICIRFKAGYGLHQNENLGAVSLKMERFRLTLEPWGPLIVKAHDMRVAADGL